MKESMRSLLCASLICGDASAFFINAPMLVRSTSGLRIRAPRSPAMASMPRRQEDAVSAQDFTIEFGMIRDTFEASADDSVDLTEGSGRVASLGKAARSVIGIGAASLTPLVSGVASASAKGGEYGIFEGKTVSFVHPIIMAVLFTVSVRAAFLGFEWREQRTMSSRMSELKAQLPMLSSGKRASTPLSGEVAGIRKKLTDLGEAAGEAHAALDADLAKLTSSAAKEVETTLNEMTARRKELSAKNVRDRHYDVGALLLGLGTFAAIEGPINTYFRAGKLFPGPHLYAGAGCVVAWAVAASMVPQMQKGNELARTAHIAINLTMIALFAWQIFTGIPIALKVWELTKFP